MFLSEVLFAFEAALDLAFAKSKSYHRSTRAFTGVLLTSSALLMQKLCRGNVVAFIAWGLSPDASGGLFVSASSEILVSESFSLRRMTSGAPLENVTYLALVDGCENVERIELLRL